MSAKPWSNQEGGSSCSSGRAVAAPHRWQGQCARTKTAALRALSLQFPENQAFEGILMQPGVRKISWDVTDV